MEMEKTEADRESNIELAYGMLGLSSIDPERRYADILSMNIKVSNSEFVETIIDLIKYYNYVDIFRSGLTEYSGMDAIANMLDRDEITSLAERDEQNGNINENDMNAMYIIHGLTKTAKKAESVENVDMDKVMKKLSSVLSMHDIIGNEMNYEKHRMFCRAFIKEFGFMPIITAGQGDLNMDAYMSVADAFDIYFAHVYESPENKKKTIISSDYYAILKNYIAYQELLHKEVVDHTKWLNMIEVARDTFTVKMIDEDCITVPDF